MAEAFVIRKLVIDTSALLPLRVYQYSQHAQLPTARQSQLLLDARSKRPPFTIREYERWAALFESAGIRLTTSHVVAEMYNVLSVRLRLKGEDRQSFWHFCTWFLTAHALIEESFKLDQLYTSPELHEINVRAGPTDAGLILLARENECILGQRDAMLVTDDERTLHVEALRLGIHCELLPNLLWAEL